MDQLDDRRLRHQGRHGAGVFARIRIFTKTPEAERRIWGDLVLAFEAVFCLMMVKQRCDIFRPVRLVSKAKLTSDRYTPFLLFLENSFFGLMFIILSLS